MHAVRQLPYEGDVPADELQPPVEARLPTAEEMQLKRVGGPLYAHDVWKICREFPSRDDYACPTDLPNLADKLRPQLLAHGFEVLDASNRFDGVRNALHLAMAYAQVVREARTEAKMFIVRRTPANCGALLMQQRLEHLQNQCSEWSPLAFIALVSDEQHVVTRDRVLSQDATEEMLVEKAKSARLRKGDDATVTTSSEVLLERFLDKQLEEEEQSRAPNVPNMPAALFRQQMRAMSDMLAMMELNEKNAAEKQTHVAISEVMDNDAVNDAVNVA